MYNLICKLQESGSLSLDEYETLIHNRSEISDYSKAEALKLKRQIYGDDIYIRGLIEISSYCKNDCLYCGIRRSNANALRYRLSYEEILACCSEGYKLGFRTFVLQGGEDAYYTDDRLCPLIAEIKRRHPDCAVTLSLGERSLDSYKRLRDAGADRYLLRHETADREHYAKLHPCELSFDERMKCLASLREIGYQVGCGFMVGSPYQTERTLAKDLKFIEVFKPDMCGIGPFIPHHDTPFANEKAGTAELTCFLLSIIRIIHPRVLLPSTTALNTIDSCGREKGILSGANVVMPNLSPLSARKKYMLYDNKKCTEEESAQSLYKLSKRMESIGCRIAICRGDIKK